MDKRIVELILGCAALTWGVWLLLPFAIFPTSPTFRVMGEIAPEWVWGLLMAGAGLQSIIGVMRQSYTMRRWSLAVMAALWLASWTAFVLGNWRSTTSVHYLWWFVLCAYSYLRAYKNGAGQH